MSEMAKKLLIDASHAEETRVAAVDGGEIIGFEFESESKQQIIGNIYLARVVRIEAALQAVFVEYGGNRHGFLTFNEIHPDYYNIPVADQQDGTGPPADAGGEDSDAAFRDADSEAAGPQTGEDGRGSAEDEAGTEPSGGAAPEEAEDSGGDSEAASAASDDSTGAPGKAESRTQKQRRKYRVQEVIRKSQIFLVQVTKDERGGKGAALTTYISLVGRYCVLMPNSDRGGGISRKISNMTDRHKLKAIAADIAVPQEAGLIIRTAGVSRTKQEIRRDYDFLVRQWNEIRQLTLKSVAPAKIYEEGNLIRRSIRDDYTRDMDEILVQGDDGYKTAKNFMKMIMPSHAKKVKQHSLPVPIFACHDIENEVGKLFDPVVQLSSGGYIVIDRTEALVAVDVNSGRATRQGTLEKTALQTNLEAAETIAAQLRLRDLAGIIVIDFIDMEEQKNNQSVERRLKECLKSDRSRIQIGHISGFGLLEMSRQRLKPGIQEIATRGCPHCLGSGRVRTDDSLAIDILRRIETEAAKDQQHTVQAVVPLRLANLLLNRKRTAIQEIEARHGVSVVISGAGTLEYHDIEIRRLNQSVSEADGEEEHVIGVETPFQPVGPAGEQRSDRQKRRRRRGGRKQQRDADGAGGKADAQSGTDTENEDPGRQDKEKTDRKPGRKRRRPSAAATEKESSDDAAPQKAADAAPSGKGRSRSSRRRRRSRGQAPSQESLENAPDNPQTDLAGDAASSAADQPGKPSSGRRRRKKPKEPEEKAGGSGESAETEPQAPASPAEN